MAYFRYCRELTKIQIDMYFGTCNDHNLRIDYIMKKDNLYFLIVINSLFHKVKVLMNIFDSIFTHF